VLLHGLGSSGEDWRYQVPALGRHYRLILVDLPGHGRSALPPGRPSVERMAGDVAALLTHLGEPPVHVLGLSLGGCVGLALALRAPSQVRSLTLVNAFARLRPAGGAAAARLALRVALLATAPMPVVGALVARSLFPRPEQEALRRMAAERLGRTSRRAYGVAMAALAGFDARGTLARVACPTMVVAGADDHTVDIDVKEMLARGIRGARWVVVPGSGHVTNVDEPDAFNAVVMEFLAAH
jgi:3-oxoadipate enol-lactonase